MAGHVPTIRVSLNLTNEIQNALAPKNFDARTGVNLGQLPADANTQALALDPSGDYFYILDNQGKIRRWRLR